MGMVTAMTQLSVWIHAVSHTWWTFIPLAAAWWGWRFYRATRPGGWLHDWPRE